MPETDTRRVLGLVLVVGVVGGVEVVGLAELGEVPLGRGRVVAPVVVPLVALVAVGEGREDDRRLHADGLDVPDPPALAGGRRVDDGGHVRLPHRRGDGLAVAVQEPVGRGFVREVPDVTPLEGRRARVAREGDVQAGGADVDADVAGVVLAADLEQPAPRAPRLAVVGRAVPVERARAAVPGRVAVEVDEFVRGGEVEGDG
ncbi:MAG: hypothetical protein ABEJ42_06950 [Halobacteriaceae archaeon]